MEQQYYTIKIAAELCGMHEQSLRMYERRGLIAPQRSPGNIRRFSAQEFGERMLRVYARAASGRGEYA